MAAAVTSACSHIRGDGHLKCDMQFTHLNHTKGVMNVWHLIQGSGMGDRCIHTVSVHTVSVSVQTWQLVMALSAASTLRMAGGTEVRSVWRTASA